MTASIITKQKQLDSPIPPSRKRSSFGGTGKSENDYKNILFEKTYDNAPGRFKAVIHYTRKDTVILKTYLRIIQGSRLMVS